MMDYLAIDKEAIPYRFTTKIDGKTYTFEVHYNSEGDFFTVDLYDSTGETLLATGEKISYGRPLFGSYTNPDFPAAAIMPWDMAGRETRVGWDNFMETVFCYIVTAEDVENA